MAFVIVLFVTAALIGMAGIALWNALIFPRLKTVTDSQPLPPISVLIPARNEAAVIGQTVRALLAQDVESLEVIVLDDGSTDGTADAAQEAARGDPRFRLITGAPLPGGWLGKNWACHQLADAARGDWLIFTDADVRWEAGALRVLLNEIERGGADMQTVWPTQETVTWGERLVVPLMALVVLAYLPVFMVHHAPFAAFAAANGQCLAFRRSAYAKIGGHAAVRASIVEDIALARRAKQAGLRLRMADGAALIRCRMYDSWAAVRDGYAKNILAGYGDQVIFLAVATVFHWLVFLAPLAWLLFGAGWGLPGWPLWPLALVALGVAVRALTAAVTLQRVRDAVLMPVSVLLMTRIAVQAVWWRWRYGGPQWKGRVLRRQHSVSG